MGFHSHSAMVKAGSTVSKVIRVIKVVNKLLKVNRQSRWPNFPTMYQAPDISSGAKQSNSKEKKQHREGGM